MSIDLSWAQLDSSLSTKLVEILNRTLSTTTRPSFIGPVEVTSLEFGTAAPDVELIDLCDIYRDFLEDDEEDSEGVKVKGDDEEEEFEWVSRKAARLDEMQIPAHLRFARRGNPMDMFASTPNLPPFDCRPTFATSPPPTPSPSLPQPARASPSPPTQAPNTNHPNLQLHFHINWHSDLRITLTTSLLINYPSPMFMSLPIKLSVIGLIFTGEIAVAYEGERSRVHLCILDDLDPYAPRSKPSPPDEDQRSKPLPIGQRLLPSIFIESEIGQADKHVLKNVTRVERFIQDVIRKTIEEELVFPNFHTMVMGGQ
ncbi:mitochondrial inheritance component mdm12 [Moniliophthora roreri MCA 2997]|uniref:Mitochondrial distribution and morphology protein 12 n=2 Tax=Moniliophthora roreri TaxID=221103 RepID=V2XUB7_MONRO|nr:mitochondrial inheritance component mdm12 [Moniliophthora roreri MCA 2997]KAI3619647.1 mitochondrial inheritance component mdm12 [Moniliophthora roreri]